LSDTTSSEYDNDWDNGGDYSYNQVSAGEGIIHWYQQGAKSHAYYFLGHVAHLLVDMSVPAHVQNDEHAGSWEGDIDDDNYEIHIASWESNFNDFIFKYWGRNNVSSPASESTLYSIFHTLGKFAARYESDDEPGEEFPHTNEDHAEEGTGDVSWVECDIHATDLMPKAIKYVAGLYKYFAKKVDGQKPATSSSFPSSPDGENGWYLTDMTISLDATDSPLNNGAGVDRIRYKINSGAWNYINAPAGNFWVTTEGENTVQYYAVDKLGFTEDIHSITIKIDPEPPTVTNLEVRNQNGNLVENGGIVSGTVTVLAEVTDNVDVAKVEFYIDNELKDTDNSSPYQYNWDTSGYQDGQSYTITAKAYDQAGNMAEDTITVIVNNTSDNNPPNPPTFLAQFKSDGSTGLGFGGTTDERSVVLIGDVTDPDGNAVSLEVEVKPVGVAFSNSPSSNCSSGGMVASGGTAVVTCSGLADGQYHWQARAKDSFGTISAWQSAGGGNSENDADFIVFGQPSAPDIDIVQIEYFFDTDPGFGNGTSISVTPDNVVTVQTTIDVSDLSLGLHRLYVRAKDENGNWGIVQSRPVLIQETDNDSPLPNIAGVEYFFDEDTGLGSGSSLSLTQNDTVEISTNINVSGLNVGLHRLYVRAQDGNGQWGIVQSRPVLVQMSAPNDPLPNIVDVEYFFDEEPELGSGSSLSFTQNDTVEISTNIDVSGLDVGLHRLYVRAQDGNGQWGIVQSRPVLVQMSDANDPLPNIVDVEYFFDGDPGLGNGVSFEFTPGDTVVIETRVPLDSLALGNHSLYVRAQDEDGLWGIPQFAAFSVQSKPRISVIPNSLDFGNVNLGSQSSAQTFTISNTGDTDLVIGTITLTGTDTPEFSIQSNNCQGQALAPSASCTFEVVFLPTSAGLKSANLSIPSNDPDSPIFAVPLAGEAVDVVVANAGSDDTICSGTCTALTGSVTGGTPPYTYAWSPITGLSNPNDSTTNACPDTTTTYTLTVTDNNSCTAQDQTVVTVNPCVPNISVSPASHDFGNVSVGSQSTPQACAIANTGNTDLVLGTIIITGEGLATCQAIGCPEIDPSAFTTWNNNCQGRILAPSDSCTVDVIFSPGSAGAKIANLSISSNDPDSPTLNVLLTGEAVSFAVIIPPGQTGEAELDDKTRIETLEIYPDTMTLAINGNPEGASFALADQNLPAGVDISGLTAAVREFKLFKNGQETTEGRFKITLPYPDTISDEKAKDLRIFRMNPATNRWELVGGAVDTTEHTVTVEVDHLSIFRLAYYGLPAPNLSNIRVYPNPFKPHKGHLEISFDHLTARATIKIYDIAGELVRTIEETDGDGLATWDARNEKGKEIASGVYIYLVTDKEGHNTTGKLAIIR